MDLYEWKDWTGLKADSHRRTERRMDLAKVDKAIATLKQARNERSRNHLTACWDLVWLASLDLSELWEGRDKLFD